MKHRYERILLVDADPTFLAGLGEALRQEGLTVLSVLDSDLAPEAVEGGFMPDALLIDFRAGHGRPARCPGAATVSGRILRRLLLAHAVLYGAHDR